MDKKKLLYYELPFFTEYCSIGFLQDLIGRYVAWKINRKYKRYLDRLERAKMIELFNKLN
jgi:hypothetical protein